MDDEVPPTITFVKTEPRYGVDGSPLALTIYMFTGGQMVITVEVMNAAIRTLGGQLSSDEVKVAARTLVELQTSASPVLCGGGTLVLDENNMAEVAKKLGWSKRFNREA